MSTLDASTQKYVLNIRFPKIPVLVYNENKAARHVFLTDAYIRSTLMLIVRSRERAQYLSALHSSALDTDRYVRDQTGHRPGYTCVMYHTLADFSIERTMLYREDTPPIVPIFGDPGRVVLTSDIVDRFFSNETWLNITVRSDRLRTAPLWKYGVLHIAAEKNLVS